MPQVSIVGGGSVTLTHVGIYRDIHYLDKTLTRNRGWVTLRAGNGNPLKLGKDEFFVLGDNSPASADGRYWSKPQVANPGKDYRAGIVPRDYIIGKAFFVYWPGPSKISDNSKFRIIPYMAGLKPIIGGSYSPDGIQ